MSPVNDHSPENIFYFSHAGQMEKKLQIPHGRTLCVYCQSRLHFFERIRSEETCRGRQLVIQQQYFPLRIAGIGRKIRVREPHRSDTTLKLFKNIIAAEAGAVVRMSFHKIELDLQLVRVAPEIIAFANRDVFAPSPGKIVNKIYPYTLGILILRLVDRSDDLRILRFVLADDVGGIVGRGVIVNQDLKREFRLLHDKSFQTIANIRTVIVSYAADY